MARYVHRAKIIPFRRRPPQAAGQRSFYIMVAALCCGVFSAIFLWDGGPLTSAAPIALGQKPTGEFDVRFAVCGAGRRVTCVIDGDTIWLNGSKIRIADINTPETSDPGCASERALGEQATARLTELLNQGPFDLARIDRDEDRYGRKLRIIERGGDSLGQRLVSEGLAEEWTGSRKNWC